MNPTSEEGPYSSAPSINTKKHVYWCTDTWINGFWRLLFSQFERHDVWQTCLDVKKWAETVFLTMRWTFHKCVESQLHSVLYNLYKLSLVSSLFAVLFFILFCVGEDLFSLFSLCSLNICLDFRRELIMDQSQLIPMPRPQSPGTKCLKLRFLLSHYEPSFTLKGGMEGVGI